MATRRQLPRAVWAGDPIRHMPASAAARALLNPNPSLRRGEATATNRPSLGLGLSRLVAADTGSGVARHHPTPALSLPASRPAVRFLHMPAARPRAPQRRLQLLPRQPSCSWVRAFIHARRVPSQQQPAHERPLVLERAPWPVTRPSRPRFKLVLQANEQRTCLSQLSPAVAEPMTCL